jgi:hypothetical protein
MTEFAAEQAFFSALAWFAGNVDGRDSDHLCDLSGTKPGRLTATDVIDHLSDDVGRRVPKAAIPAVLDSYTRAFNKAVKGELGGSPSKAD